jgi:hypothetical protein
VEKKIKLKFVRAFFIFLTSKNLVQYICRD